MDTVSEESDQNVATGQASDPSRHADEVREKTIDQLIPVAPTVSAEKRSVGMPIVILVSMLALTVAAAVFNKQSLDLRSRASTSAYPTTIVLPVYILNSGSGQTCASLCDSQTGRKCVSVGTDAEASNGQYFSRAKGGTEVCSLGKNVACSTIMKQTASCRTSADPTAPNVAANATRCKCQ